MTARQHRHQLAYPALWRAIDGAIRDAVAAHPDIQIADKRRASIVKRAVGAVLALQGVGAGQPAETAAAQLARASANGAHFAGVAGLAHCDGQPQRREGEP